MPELVRRLLERAAEVWRQAFSPAVPVPPESPPTDLPCPRCEAPTTRVALDGEGLLCEDCLDDRHDHVWLVGHLPRVARCQVCGAEGRWYCTTYRHFVTDRPVPYDETLRKRLCPKCHFPRSSCDWRLAPSSIKGGIDHAAS